MRQALHFSTTADNESKGSVLAKVEALNICIIAGSTRTSGPPRPVLSDHVTSFIQSTIISRSGQTQGEGHPESNNQVTVFKARNMLPLLERPHFTYPPSSASFLPNDLQEIYESLQAADAYIVITPKYNHLPCPGLMNFMNDFGLSTFRFKPSAIVSYSAGQWGGTRAEHSLRPFLSELGCLPVSAMVHIPNAAGVLDEDGKLIVRGEGDSAGHFREIEHWEGYVGRMLGQLEWWAAAAKVHKEAVDPLVMSPVFWSSPSERNAPQ